MSVQLARFAAVGAAATCMHVAAYFAAHGAGTSLVLANLFGFLAGSFCSFLGHYHFTFAVKGNYRDYVARFAVASLMGLALTTLTVQLTTESLGFSPRGAIAVVILIVPLATFAAHRFWAFAGGRGFEAQAAVLVVAGLSLYLLRGAPLNHDSSWYLVSVQRWLNGATLYEDILELNPPLAFYLTAPSVLLGRVLGVDATLAFLATTFGAAVISSLVSVALVERVLRPSRVRLGLFGAFAGAGLLLVPLPDFGQREHLMIILSTPLLVLLALGDGRSVAPMGYRLPIVLIGGMGLMLKPHFFVPIVCVAFLEMLSHIRGGEARRGEYVGLLALGIAYAIFVQLVHPEYYGFMLPLSLGSYTYTEVTFSDLSGDVLLVVAPFFVPLCCVRSGTRVHQLALRSLAIVLGFGLAYVLQMKGWTYQMLPIRSFALTAAGLLIAIGAVSAAKPAWPLLVALTGALSANLYAQVSYGPYRNYTTAWFERYLDGTPNVDSIMVLSTNVSAGFPLVNRTGVAWASRFPTLWLVPAIANGGVSPGACRDADHARCAAMDGGTAEFLRRAVVEDLIRFEADVVFVDEREKKSYINVPFDYVDFLSANAAFRDLWNRFDRVGRVGSYGVWRRISDAPPFVSPSVPDDSSVDAGARGPGPIASPDKPVPPDLHRNEQS